MLQADGEAARESKNCVYCKEATYKLYWCSKFKDLDVKDRLGVVSRNRLCFNCFNPNHRTKECKLTSYCSKPGCKFRHSRLLHADEDGTGAASGGKEAIHVPIVRVQINGVEAWALLDTGSTNTFISKHLADQLKLSGKCITYDIKTINSTAQHKSQLVNFDVNSENGHSTSSVRNALVINKIPARSPSPTFDIKNHYFLGDIDSVVPPPGVQADILIGLDNPDVLRPIDIRYSDKQNQPYAVLTKLGWALQGPSQLSRESSPHISVASCMNIDADIHKLWEIEGPDSEERILSK